MQDSANLHVGATFRYVDNIPTAAAFDTDSSEASGAVPGRIIEDLAEIVAPLVCPAMLHEPGVHQSIAWLHLKHCRQTLSEQSHVAGVQFMRRDLLPCLEMQDLNGRKQRRVHTLVL